MKQLRLKFIGIGEVRGFEFTQIKRTEYGYIYEVNKGNSIHFEVFKHRENKQFSCISYPKTKSFGIWAWTVSSLERANEVLESFNKSI